MFEHGRARYMVEINHGTNVTRSDKRVTKCQFGHPELSIPTESAIKELSFDISFKLHNTKVKLWPLKSNVVVEWPFLENGTKRIYTALVKVGFCHLRCVLKSCIRPNGL